LNYKKNVQIEAQKAKKVTRFSASDRLEKREIPNIKKSD
jgi:hypothetical protein